ncbi:hypothetical protein YERSI8AC_40128 [Enterobacterales bacterium 8AC]|nr:hypothetical protein YERSI8AC_40128 [Enterobacterales bacterium 8AC]
MAISPVRIRAKKIYFAKINGQRVMSLNVVTLAHTFILAKIFFVKAIIFRRDFCLNNKQNEKIKHCRQ